MTAFILKPHMQRWYRAARSGGAFHPTVLPGPDGSLPLQQSEWVQGRGWYDGASYATVSDYLTAASGTFSRASDATYFDADGILRTASSGDLRLDHDPTTGAALGLRVEGQRANTALWAEDFGNAVWAKTNAAVTPDVAQGLRGSVTADRISETAASGEHRILQSAPLLPGEIWAWQACVCPAERRRMMLTFGGSSAANWSGDRIVAASFDLDALTASFVTGAAHTEGPLIIRNMLSGYRHCAVTSSLHTGSGSAVPAVILNLLNDENSRTYAGDEVAGGIVAFAQRETARFASSLIPTAGSVATRLADALSYNISGSSTGTILLAARTPLGIDGDQTLWCWDDGTTSNRLRLVRDDDGKLRFIVTVAAAEVVNLDLGPLANDTDFTVAASWQSGLFAASLDGASAVTSNAYGGSLPAVTTMREGSASDGAQWFGTIARLVRYAGAYTPAQLEGMTA